MDFEVEFLEEPLTAAYFNPEWQANTLAAELFWGFFVVVLTIYVNLLEKYKFKTWFFLSNFFVYCSKINIVIGWW